MKLKFNVISIEFGYCCFSYNYIVISSGQSPDILREGETGFD